MNGSPVREYIFANDAARGMILALEKYCEADPVNLSSGESITIIDLAKKILKISNYDPEITYSINQSLKDNLDVYLEMIRRKRCLVLKH